MADLKTNQQLLCRLSALQRHQQADNDYNETSEEDLQVPESEHCLETLPETVYKKKMELNLCGVIRYTHLF